MGIIPNKLHEILKLFNLRPPLYIVTHKPVIFNIFCVIVNDDQAEATILAYLFIPNQLYMFRVMSLPIVRST